MRVTLIAGLALALSAGCQKNDRAAEREEERGVTLNTESAKPAADNTDRNERDRDPNALTPGDQGENERDRTITQEARQRVMKQDNLSMNAQNAKIITKDGVVTLRGPVDSASEKSQLGELARSVPGVTRVDNQLEITSK